MSAVEISKENNIAKSSNDINIIGNTIIDLITNYYIELP